MTYEFKCQEHGVFEIEQNINDEHRAGCPICNKPTQRVYTRIGHYYDNPKPLYHKDGSYEER